MTSLKLSLHPEAEVDVAEAISFYDRRTAGLGSDFLGEVLQTFADIEDAPEAWPLLEGQVRRCLVKRFPHGVYYRIDLSIVVAVMHTRRKPGAWRGRT